MIKAEALCEGCGRGYTMMSVEFVSWVDIRLAMMACSGERQCAQGWCHVILEGRKKGGKEEG